MKVFLLLYSIPGISQSNSERPVLAGKDTVTTGTLKEEYPSEAYISHLNNALNFQYVSDSLTKVVLSLRGSMDNISNDEKLVIKSRISQLERSAAEYQRKAYSQLDEAKKYSGEDPERKVPSGNTVSTDSVKARLNSGKPLQTDSYIIINDTTGILNKGSVPVASESYKGEPKLADIKNQKPAEGKAVPQKNPADIYSVFEISDKKTYNPDEKVPVNLNVEPGLIYRIQVAVFKNPVSPSYFKGITPVFGFKSEGSDFTIYYAGLFRKAADASKALLKVRSAGFKDAFVVALMDRKIVSSERAATLEKEWGKKPFAAQAQVKPADIVQDTVPPVLVFRVEVIKSKKPLTADQFDNVKRLAGNRGLDVVKIPSGQTIYLIGKFLTFESAAEYTDLLSRNGYKEARVTAYLGQREIPVETARQLFEKY